MLNPMLVILLLFGKSLTMAGLYARIYIRYDTIRRREIQVREGNMG